MSETRYLTREEAATVCACHVDTIRRDERMGRLPNARKRPDGVVEIPVSDLVAAGRLDPLAADAPLTEIVTKSRAERELLEARQRIALLESRVAALEGEIRRADREVDFLRALLREKKVA